MSKLPKVLFLYHGGTIGQLTKIKDGKAVLFPPKDDKEFKKACDPVLKKFADRLDINFEFVTSKDSTNMTPNDWEKLIFRVKKAQDEEKYDAVAIAHGTDTLAYTAVALSLGLHGKNPIKTGLRIPVCITGSQNPIYKEGGDGRFNLENLFRTIGVCIDKGVADVIVNFWNKILLGSRTLKLNERNFDAFGSPAFPDVGVIDAAGITLFTHLLKKKADAAPKLQLAPKFGRGVVSFELSPGIEPSVVLGFITGGGISAMIFKSLGEGNVCTEGEFNMLPVIKQAVEEYVTPIFITTKFIGGISGAMHYEVGFHAVKMGGIACLDHTDVAVDVKVRWLIGNGMCANIDDFRKSMSTSYAGEVSP